MTQKSARTPPAADAAKAFEELRHEISLQRTAIQGLTSAKEKLPDYLPTLRDIASRLGEIEEHIKSIDGKPAMQLTPRTIAMEIHEALMSYRADDAKSIGEARDTLARTLRSEEHTSELQSLMRNSYAVFCLKKKNNNTN